jgi:prepilin peptidase CpaA
MPAAVEMARWFIAILFSIVLLVASVSDIRDRRIPNWTVLALVILFVPWIFVGSHVLIISSLEAALLAFIVSVTLYALRIVGAGDSKLLTAVSLFVGLDHLFTFFMLVALAGGAIAAVSLGRNPVRALVMFQMRGKGDFGRGVPYGVAIAVAAVSIISWSLLRNLN